MKYVYFSDGTDNGKPFNSLEEAIEYLYQQAHHSKIHLNGVLKDMKVSEDAFILYIEEYNFFRGRAVEEIGIRIASKDDAEKIKFYFNNQMSKQAFYNGILYQIEYQPQLSNNDYTQHKVYHIKTEDENYPHARKAIASIMEDELGYKQGEIWNKGLYKLKNDKEPSMLNALHVYYEFSYNEELDMYVYTFVRPYDD